MHVIIIISTAAALVYSLEGASPGGTYGDGTRAGSSNYTQNQHSGYSKYTSTNSSGYTASYNNPGDDKSVVPVYGQPSETAYAPKNTAGGSFYGQHANSSPVTRVTKSITTTTRTLTSTTTHSTAAPRIPGNKQQDAPPPACPLNPSLKSEKEREVYASSCAELPPGLRDYVGCPIEMPYDLSLDKVKGDAPIENYFVNDDLKQSPQLVEGDIRTPSTTDINGIRQVCGNHGIWAGGVPYVIDAVFSSDQVAFITQRMCSIGNRTCVRFFPRSNEKDFIKIVSRHGCWSYVGRQGGKQLVSLEILNENGQSCLNGTSVEHELLHVLGFLHEHTRMDRDEFIKIDLDNVEAKFRGQFAKYSRRNSWYRRIPYDIRSVMHYASEAFARDPQKPVITTLTLQNGGSITLSELIQPATVLSDLDYERINEAYGCSPQSPGLTCGVPLTGSTSGYGYSANDDNSCVYRSSIATGLDDGSSDPVTDNTCKKFNPGSAGHPG